MGHKMKNYLTPLLVALLVLLSVFGYTQTDLPITQQAIQQCLNKDLSSALATVDRAVGSPEEKDSPRSWYVKSFIHKEIFKTSTIPTIIEEHRTKSVEALEKCIEIDINNTEWEQCRVLLDYIAAHYYNEANSLATSRSNQDNEKPLALFKEFKRLKSLSSPGSNLAKDEKQFKVAMGQRYYSLWESAPKRDTDLIEKSESYFLEAMAIDTSDCEISYNIVVGLYNRGVYKIRQLGTSTDISELIMIQEESVNLFKKAIPYIKHAYANCPNKPDVVRAMYFIHRSLDREEAAEKYKQELETLLRNK